MKHLKLFILFWSFSANADYRPDSIIFSENLKEKLKVQLVRRNHLDIQKFKTKSDKTMENYLNCLNQLKLDHPPVDCIIYTKYLSKYSVIDQKSYENSKKSMERLCKIKRKNSFKLNKAHFHRIKSQLPIKCRIEIESELSKFIYMNSPSQN